MGEYTTPVLAAQPLSLTQDIAQSSPWKEILKMKSSLVLCALLAAAAAKFCPGEKNRNKCRAGDNSYKCSVFFEDLTPKRPLTWIGALPDALKKAKNKAEAAEILGADVTEESFNNFPGCQDSAANARCYTTLNKQRSVPLDSCDENLINTSGSETIGDYLCKQVRRWLKNSSSFKADGTLCCNPDGTFYRCSGEEFNDKC